jgi:ABC-type dipeptide/oligopeptide/nickel transport system ATPase component
MSLLEVRDLRLHFTTAAPDRYAVDGISFSMEPGEKLGLVGESGSGKTVTALSIAGLLERAKTEVEGEVMFEGRDLMRLPRSEMRQIQGRDIGVIFQEPMTSLNPLMKIGPQVEETLKLHTNLSREERRKWALDVMEHVGLPEPEKTYNKYPHQLSGGQRQRAMIASAFICDPKLLICDEPTTALDVTVQKQIIELLGKINEAKGVAMLFISHDLNVVRKLCDRVIVMYRGKIVEQGQVQQIFENPQHDYTKKLIAAIPTRRKRGV